MSIVVREGDGLVLPGIASAHSHAFQRALRGRTQAMPQAGGSFWSWRALMYELAGKIDPDGLHALSHFAFVELARCGVTHVGEFHYLHHDPKGVPYGDRLELADAVVRAALDAGLRITLLRVLYERGGWGRALDPVQRRFADGNVDDALSDVDALAKRYSNAPRVRIGLAPHSVRAVTRSSLEAAGRFARARRIPLHAHVSEQPREIHECLAEHGIRPVELLAEAELLDARFVGVHGTHLSAREVGLLAGAGAGVCVCRTTERDLGDGAPDVSALVHAKVPLSIGVDSHAVSDPFEEARAIELDERTRTGRRTVALGGTSLLEVLGEHGHRALGVTLDASDRVVLDANDVGLVGAADDRLDDAVAFGATARAVRRVVVDGRTIVEDGRHEGEPRAREAFERTLRALLS